VLLNSRPVLLLALNANDLHCALTTVSVPVLPWFVLATLRRIAEDPLFFLVGWHYREPALLWLYAICQFSASVYASCRNHLRGSCIRGMVRRGKWSPRSEETVRKTEALFRRSSYAAVLIDPGAIVCCLAGASRMPLERATPPTHARISMFPTHLQQLPPALRHWPSACVWHLDMAITESLWGSLQCTVTRCKARNAL
jgi:membrane protein YqaA with SNARE-associated domain